MLGSFGHLAGSLCSGSGSLAAFSGSFRSLERVSKREDSLFSSNGQVRLFFCEISIFSEVFEAASPGLKKWVRGAPKWVRGAFKWLRRGGKWVRESGVLLKILRVRWVRAAFFTFSRFREPQSDADEG